VVQVGAHVESETTIYLVEFSEKDRHRLSRDEIVPA